MGVHHEWTYSVIKRALLISGYTFIIALEVTLFILEVVGALNTGDARWFWATSNALGVLYFSVLWYGAMTDD